MQASDSSEGIPQSLRRQMVQAAAAMRDGPHPLADPIHQGAAYSFSDSVQADVVFQAGNPLYARDGMPNVRSLERVVAGLEGADDAIAVSSGMAAIAMACLTLLQSGDHVVFGCDGYCDTAALLADLESRFGIATSRVDLGDARAVREAMRPSTKLILAETISNPGMRLADLPALATIAEASGALLVVDNTVATPVFCRPLEHGAALVIHSGGKFIGGHSDATSGIVAGNRDLIGSIRRSAYLYGPLLAPLEAWLTLRGIKTLMPRMTWSSTTTVAVAAWLRDQVAVAAVNHVGLPGHDQESLVRRLLPDGCGSLLSFRLAGGEGAAFRLLDRLQMIPYAPTIGGTVTIASFPPHSPEYDCHGRQIITPYRDDTIRLSIGLEAADDIIADLSQALAGMDTP